MSVYSAPNEVLVYLISEKVNGTAERRLAAEFILYCVRSFKTPGEIAECIEHLEANAILDVADDARRLALSLGLIES